MDHTTDDEHDMIEADTDNDVAAEEQATRRQADMFALLDRYVERRLLGYAPATCAQFIGISLQNSFNWAKKAESQRYVQRKLDEGLRNLSLPELWNVKVSVWELLNILRFEGTKDTSKVAALKELNVIMGITFVDEKGRTVSRGLDDFYKDVNKDSK